MISVLFTGAAQVNATASSADASDAVAAGKWGCEYPYVCLYDVNANMVEKYKVITSGWQTFSRRDIYYAVNTRNDDIAYIRFTNGKVFCLPAGNPDRYYYLDQGTPNAIRISSSSTC
jgi:hypothetical protein